MSRPRLALTRAQVLAFRRRVGALDERSPAGPDSLRQAAWAGLQDSMPRAALLSIHARVEGAGPSTWADPSLVQLWGPRFSAYVVSARDVPVFTLGRLPDEPVKLRFAQQMAARLHDFLDGRRMTYGEVGHALGINPNALRYAAPTGTVLMRWEGARQPVVWTVPAPDVDPFEARLELARRYLHVLGPGTAASFGEWAGIRPSRALAAFDRLAAELTEVSTPIGSAWVLAADEPVFGAPAVSPAPARLLPSGDAYFLLWGRQREVLVTDAARRSQLWTPRVWPGALLVSGEVAGTWRRAAERLTVETWRALSPAERAAVEAEAASLPLPGLTRPPEVDWS